MRNTTTAWFRFGLVIGISLFAVACAVAAGTGEHSESAGEGERGEHSESAGEHERGEGDGDGEGEGDGEGDGEGEESGVYIGAADTWDAVRRGARLILAFNGDSGAFEGTVRNTTAARLCGVRVEVHLRNGPELGPTPRTDLGPGETADLTLPLRPRGQAFTSWTAHPEMDACT